MDVSTPTSQQGPLRRRHHSSSSSHAEGLLNPAPLRSRGHRRSHRRSRDASSMSASSSTSSKDSSNADTVRRHGSFGRPSKAPTAAFPGQYQYEWHEPSFFNHPDSQRVPLLSQRPGETPQKVGSPASQERKTAQAILEGQHLDPLRGHHSMNIGKMMAHPDTIVMVEVAGGTHQLVEVSATEVMHRVRAHVMQDKIPTRPQRGNKSTIGELTYRDIRQVFTEGQAAPSIEVRRNCIVLCLPPVTALILHDRCCFVVNDELDTDSLILRLTDITGTYAQRAEATANYFLRSHSDGDIGRAVPSTQPTFQTHKLAKVPSARTMMFDGQDLATPPVDAEDKVPRFISFPLEFAMLEILLRTAFETLQHELEEMEDSLDRVERKVTKHSPSSSRLEDLHIIKSPCQVYSDTIKALSEAFQLLLNSPADMIHMELTKLFYRPELYNEPTQEDDTANVNLEIMLEFFDQEINQFERRVCGLLRSIDNTEKLLTLRMMLTRNSLVYYELAGTILTTFLNVGTCVSGIFGMNLLNGAEDSHEAFLITTGLISGVAVLGMVLVFFMIYSNKM